MPNNKGKNKLAKQEKRVCKLCNKPFKTTVADKVYCSDKCLSLSRVLNLQKMWNEGKIKPKKISNEAFYEITNFIKRLLAVELIRKGYFINGVRQNNYGDEELLDCFIFVMDHVFGNFIKRSGKQSDVKYDPTRVNLATFIYIWTRGYCSLVRQTDKNRYNVSKHRILSLDEVTETYTPEELIENELTNNINSKLEQDIFDTNISKNIFDNLYSELSEELEDNYINWN